VITSTYALSYLERCIEPRGFGAGYTENGVPFGVTWDEIDDTR
jgi:hypothetical protein